MRLKLLAAALLFVALGGLAHAQFGPRQARGQIRAPRIVEADELRLSDKQGRTWRVVVRGGQLVVVPADVRPQGGPWRW